MYQQFFQHGFITPKDTFIYTTQVIYLPCCQHTHFYPESTFYACVDSSLCSSSMSLVYVLSSAWLNQCWRHKIWIYNYGAWRQWFNSNLLHQFIYLFHISAFRVLYEYIFLGVFQSQSYDSFTISMRYKCRFWDIINIWIWYNTCWLRHYLLWL